MREQYLHQATESIRLLCRSVEQFAQKEIAPIADKLDIAGTIPKHIWQALGKLGLLGITIEEKYTGVNLGYFAQVLVMEILSTYSASLGLSFIAHANLCVNQIQLFGTHAQKTKYLPDLVSGDKVGALAISEHEAGSDAVSMQLKAVDCGDYFELCGHKMWITNAPIADTFVVYAKTNPSAKSKGITAFIVERNFPGISIGDKLDKFGVRGSPTAEIIFDNCKVPKSNVLGDIDAGIKVLMTGLDYERVVIAAGPVGIMQACIDTVIPYIKERKQFGKCIASFQLMQAKIANMYTSLQSSRCYLYQVAQLCDLGKITNQDAASVLLLASENAINMALESIQSLGANGYMNEYPTGRYLCDAKLFDIGAGTKEIRQILIGKKLLS